MVFTAKLYSSSYLLRNISLKKIINYKFIPLISHPNILKTQSNESSFPQGCHQLHSSSLKLFQENSNTKALTVLDNVKQVRQSPAAALVLGFAGLIPFVAAPSYIIACGVFLPSVTYIQLAYGASILSFIGGIRWGLTLPQGSTQTPDWHNLGYSVLPSLVAWGSLLVSPSLGAVTVMGGLCLTGYMDIAMWGYPNWFKGMRFCLTLVAVLSLWTTLMCGVIMDTEKPKKLEAGKKE